VCVPVFLRYPPTPSSSPPPACNMLIFLSFIHTDRRTLCGSLHRSTPCPSLLYKEGSRRVETPYRNYSLVTFSSFANVVFERKNLTPYSPGSEFRLTAETAGCVSRERTRRIPNFLGIVLVQGVMGEEAKDVAGRQPASVVFGS